MKFNEVTCILLFVLNNKKYNSHNISKFDLSDFLNDFYENLETSNFVNLSILPLHIVKNIMNTSLLIRKFYSEALLLDMECTKLIVYFAIIYSSQVDLIHNPHLRSEIFDILLYFFISNPQERNSKQNTQLLKILNDEFVKENLIYSLMRVFIDAERLGTSNQFYEKFSIRNKILYLIENLMKTHKSIYSDKFLDFANKFRFDTIKMINLLMNDLTFLIDECIERLMQIKKFQDLRADVERYNALDEETKQLETDKFNDNDQRVRTELKVN
jgi:ubiquitin conjugation factor E4 B